VGHTLIFDNHKAQQLGFNQDHPYLIRGLGDQPALKAFQVKINRLNIANFHIEHITALVLPESEFILSKRIGTHIDGIIGRDLFMHFPVLINYPRKYLEINPVRIIERWKKKITHLPLHFYNHKPYVKLTLPQLNEPSVHGNFLIDTGLSDAIWLFSKGLDFQKTHPVFEDFLGTGINGDVYGERGKIPSLVIGKTLLNEIKVTYPAVKTFDSLVLEKNRLGSIGAELLSRFKVLIDYPKNQLMLKPTNKTSDPFYYNLSGIELAYEGTQIVKHRLPSVERKGNTGNNGIEILLQDSYKLSFHPVLKITYVRPNSPAEYAGLRSGDILIQINGRKIHEMSLEKVLAILQKEPGEKIKLTVKREDHLRKFTFRLQSFFSSLSYS
ncbi:MAG: PDZ domain-containing protein, partial [Flavobacteriaceae bacterium]